MLTNLPAQVSSFIGRDAELRRAFVYKEKPSHTPPHLARHRTTPEPSARAC